MTDLIALSDHSKVWIYQSDSFFTEEEIPLVQGEIASYLQQWSSHGRDLRAYGNLFHQRFVALFVDEEHHSASGCSIDDSVRFIQYLGKKFQKNLMDRMHFTYIQDNEVHSVSMQDLPSLYTQGAITDETLFFDNLVKTKSDFISSWLKPLQSSWHYRFVE